MDAKQVQALIAAQYPSALNSPLARLMRAASALTALEASDADAVALRAEAMAHARECLFACDGWTVETLAHNIESQFGGELSADECDEIARSAMVPA